MIISYSWLKEMVDLPVSPSELAEVLTFLGLEVEQMTHFRPRLNNVVIGEVLECAHIEGTDHLSITQTKVGGETLPIVCGAPNVRAGLKVVVMLPGSETADGMKIKKSKLRGHESHGMLASERELGLADDHTGIIEGDADWTVGAAAENYLNLPDTVYDVEVTPNRPDFLSHVGVARDLAAKFKLPWRWPEYALTESSEPADKHIAVEILAPDACPRYTARVVRGVKIMPSPFARRLRLMRCGVRPISNIVDVTNWLMLETGQPLHAFDARFVHDRKIVIRLAEPKEKFTTLDGVEHTLSTQDLLIADPVKGIGIAGIMGGLNSEIREDTEEVVIECAYFDAVHVRRSAKALGMSTDASRRFERGMDPHGVPRVIDATAGLMQMLGGGEVFAGRVDCYPKSIEPKKVSFRPQRVAVVVGVDVPRAEMKDIIDRLGCEIFDNGDKWQVTCPTFRPDLEREIDLIEEVIRVYGYESIPTANASRVPLSGSDDQLAMLRRKIADVMVGLGFHETLSVSMYAPNERLDPPNMSPGVELKNPVTDEMPIMQGSVLPHLVRAAAANYRRGDRDLRLFEIARVFNEGQTDDPRTWERQMLSAIITGVSQPTSWSTTSKPIDFFDLKGVIEVLSGKISLDKVEIYPYDVVHSGVLTGGVRSGSIEIGKWGIWPTSLMRSRDIDADVAWLELDVGVISEVRQPTLQYRQLPKFPISWRDIAVVVDEPVTAADLLTTIRDIGGEYLSRVEPIDLFRGEKLGAGKKSVAIRIEFTHPERSLESVEVDQWMNRIIEGLKVRQGAVLR